MPLTVLLAPASSGKTHWVLSRARDMAADLSAVPRVIVPSQIQAFECKQRLAELGGGLGVSISTFEELSWEVLERAGTYPARITNEVQNHLLGELLRGMDLSYYAGIREMPGFVTSLLEIFRELKAGDISPELFSGAVNKLHQEPRLAELGAIYQAYQAMLGRLGLVDPVGAIKIAGEQIQQDPRVCAGWKGIFFDGFDDLSPIQLRLVEALAAVVQPAYLTLTGGEPGPRADLIHSRFLRLKGQLSLLPEAVFEELPLEGAPGSADQPAAALGRAIFHQSSPERIQPEGRIGLAAVADREAEVRTALRWLRKLQREQQIPLQHCAVLMRSQEAYRPILERVAREYRLPVRMQGGLPLIENPLISAILALLNLAAGGKSGLGWQEVVELWRSPYFSWERLLSSPGHPLTPETHNQNWVWLAAVAHWGSVIGGFQQWEEVFSLLGDGEADPQAASSRAGLEEVGLTRQSAAELWGVFQAFCDALFLPDPSGQFKDLIAWLEDLLGLTDPDGDPHPAGLDLIENILASRPDLAERDWKALLELSRIMRDLYWSYRTLDRTEIDLQRFAEAISAVVKQTTYQPLDLELPAITCADVTEARGLSFQAVALLGLGEGEFPGAVKEDPFLRDLDRIALQAGSGLPLQVSTASHEAQYFYEAIRRTSGFLLFTRPRIAENGAAWQASPYWEELLRCLDLLPVIEATGSRPRLEEAGSLAEFWEVLAGSCAISGPAWSAAARSHPSYAVGIEQASRILSLRLGNLAEGSTAFDGGLEDLRGLFSERFPSSTIWSASRLEMYRSCPFSFFVRYILQLDKPAPPTEGLDPRQLGSVYHRILEELYQSMPSPYSLEDLLAGLPGTSRKVLDEAPSREGFRVTAWWDHTREEILENLRKSLIVLENSDPSFRFQRAEQTFGVKSGAGDALQISLSGGRSFRLGGLIDRVDLNQDGEVRIIDYKTGGAAGFTNQALRDGKKLQLPLYALAAQDALGLGPVREGFYFHVLSAQPSSLSLSGYKEGGASGPDAAIARAAESGWEAVQSIRAGEFSPQPPDSGCPDYCPAAGFCWHYQPAFR